MCRADPCMEEHQSGSALFWGLPLGQALIQRFIRLKCRSKWARFLSYAYKTAHWKRVEKIWGEKSVFADFSWFAKVKRNEVSGTLEPNYWCPRTVLACEEPWGARCFWDFWTFKLPLCARFLVFCASSTWVLAALYNQGFLPLSPCPFKLKIAQHHGLGICSAHRWLK